MLTSSFESTVAQQMQEMEMVRQKVFNLEQAQLHMKQKYKDPNLPSLAGPSLIGRVGMKTTLLAYAMSLKLAAAHRLT